MKKTRLGQDERRILFQRLSERSLKLFNQLQTEVMDLEITDYFDRYYKRLYKLIYCLERFYPNLDMSTNDIELLHKRYNMRIKK